MIVPTRSSIALSSCTLNGCSRNVWNAWSSEISNRQPFPPQPGGRSAGVGGRLISGQGPPQLRFGRARPSFGETGVPFFRRPFGLLPLLRDNLSRLVGVASPGAALSPWVGGPCGRLWASLPVFFRSLEDGPAFFFGGRPRQEVFRRFSPSTALFLLPFFTSARTSAAFDDQLRRSKATTTHRARAGRHLFGWGVPAFCSGAGAWGRQPGQGGASGSFFSSGACVQFFHLPFTILLLWHEKRPDHTARPAKKYSPFLIFD